MAHEDEVMPVFRVISEKYKSWWVSHV